MKFSKLCQRSRHILVAQAKTPLLCRQCLLQFQPRCAEHLLLLHLPLEPGKMSLHNEYMGVLCTQAAGLENLQGALNLHER
eukprot:2708014-Amphidinium_carterae.1